MGKKNLSNKNIMPPRITEDQIKAKLYGAVPSPVAAEPQQTPADLFNEDKIKKRLYGESSPSVKPAAAAVVSGPAPAAPPTPPTVLPPPAISAPIPPAVKPEEADLFRPPPRVEEPEQLAVLKQHVLALEEKLQIAEREKKRWQRSATQQQRIAEAQTAIMRLLRALPAHTNKILVGICVLLLLIILFRPAPRTPESLPVIQEPAPELPPVISAPPAPAVMAAIPVVSPEPPAPVTESSSRIYTLQVAEYGNEAAANEFVVTLRDMGFDVSIQTSYRGQSQERPYFKINVGNFSTYAEARRYIDVFREKTGVSDAFVKEKKD